jgi:hypothetical protein
MSIFKFLPWKSAAGLLPIFVEIVKEARQYVKGDEKSGLDQLIGRVQRLEKEQAATYRFIRFATFAGIALFLMSAAALVLGIIAVS